MPRTFEDKPGVRVGGVTKIGIMGPSGGGKTFSALRLATGIQRIVGGDIGVVDTENGRALMYADYFKFRHLDFQPPYRSEDYTSALTHFVDKGVKTIVVDSMTHEHAGIGGYLEFAEAELTRMAGSDYGKRKACKLASFIEPSKARAKMIFEITTRLKANFIFCFRAKEKVKPIRNEKGNLEIESIGFVPIAGTELVFEMDACCLLLPHAGGVPTWQSDEIGEKMMIKTALQFAKIFEKEQPLSEDIGQQLAEWARGGPAKPAASEPPPAAAVDLVAMEAQGAAEAAKGLEPLRKWFLALPPEVRTALKPKLDSTWKPAAEKVAAA